MKAVKVEASPSLALIKYWGKNNEKKNIPATSSLAVTLDKLKTVTIARLAEGKDRVTIDGMEQPMERYAAFFDNFRKVSRKQVYFECESSNNFPTAAGLASSASGFAALALAMRGLCATELSDIQVSAIVRLGSASAARAVFGPASVLRRGKSHAEALSIPPFWKDARVLVAQVSRAAKELPSRQAMNVCKISSPYYKSWLKDSGKTFNRGLKAMLEGNLENLGQAMRGSYLNMFSTMFSARPPIIYWLPESLKIIRACETLRKDGISAWETMDAGPQVKILCMKDDTQSIMEKIKNEAPDVDLIEDKFGPGPRLEEIE